MSRGLGAAAGLEHGVAVCPAVHAHAAASRARPETPGDQRRSPDMEAFAGLKATNSPRLSEVWRRSGGGGGLRDSPAGQEPRGCGTGLSQHGPGPLHPEALPRGDANSCLSKGAPEWRQQILRSGWQHPGHTRWPDCVPPEPADPQGDTSIIPWPEWAGLQQEAWWQNPILLDSRGYSAWGQGMHMGQAGCGKAVAGTPPSKTTQAHVPRHTCTHTCTRARRQMQPVLAIQRHRRTLRGPCKL